MPRAGLSPEVVVAEAARLADEVGHDRLTLSAVAARFGVAVPSLYKHVAGLDDLQRQLAIRGVRGLGAALGEAVDTAPAGGTFAALAHAYRRYARTSAGCYGAALRAPDPDDAEHLAETGAVLHTLLDVLAAYGLTGDDAIDAARTVRSALHGFVSLEANGGFGLPRDVDRSFDRLVDGLAATLSGWP